MKHASAVLRDDATASFAALSTRGLTDTLAGRESDPEFFGMLSILPDPDEILRRAGKDLSAFKRILADEHVEAVTIQRASAVLRQRWEVIAGGDGAQDIAAADFFREVLDALPLQMVMERMLAAPLWGLIGHEAMWERDGSRWFVGALPDRPTRRFCFDRDGNPRLKTRNNRIYGEEIPPGKFLFTRYKASAENPYGERLLSKIFWPHLFKTSGWKFWITFMEKFGMPWPVIEYAPGTTDENVNKMIQVVVTAVQDAVVAVPAGSKVQLLEAKGGKGDAHERLVRACENGISKAIVGQTLTTQIGERGSFAASQTHNAVREDIVEMDARMVEASLFEFGSWHTQLNFAQAVPPIFKLEADAKPQKDWVEVIDKSRAFLEIPKAWAHGTLGIPMPEEGDDVLGPPAAAVTPPGEGDPPGGNFADAAAGGFAVQTSAIPAMRDALADKFAPALGQVEQLLGRAVSEGEFIAALQDLAEREEPLAAEFSEALANALIRSTLAGRVSVD